MKPHILTLIFAIMTLPNQQTQADEASLDAALNIVLQKVNVTRANFEAAGNQIQGTVQMQDSCQLSYTITKQHRRPNAVYSIHLVLRTPWRAVGSYLLQQASNIQFNETNDGFTANNVYEYDCEEEGCSETTVLHQHFASTRVRIEDRPQVRAGYYPLDTLECRF